MKRPDYGDATPKEPKMKSLTGLVLICILAAPCVSAAEPEKKTDRRLIGYITIGAGAALIATAFNYKQECAGTRSTFRDGFRTVYDYCTTYSPGHFSTEETPIDITLARPTLLYAGIGATVGGVLLATVFSGVDALENVSVGIEPGAVRFEKRILF